MTWPLVVLILGLALFAAVSLVMIASIYSDYVADQKRRERNERNKS